MFRCALLYVVYLLFWGDAKVALIHTEFQIHFFIQNLTTSIRY